MPLPNLSFAGYQPAHSPHTRGAEVFAAELRRILGDNLEFTLDANVPASGRPASSILDMVEEGSRSFCYFASSYLAGRCPEISVLDLPFTMTDRAAAYAALDGALGKYLKTRMAAATNYRLLGFWDNGFRHITNGVRPIHTPHDCTGLKIRTGDSALHQATFRALGFEPTFIDVKDLPSAVADGTVDAQDNPLTNIYNFGIHEHHRHITLTGHFLGFVAVLVHAPSYDSWGTAIHTAITEALKIATDAQRGFAQAADDEILAKFDPALNDVIELNDAERSAFVDAVQPVVRAETEVLGSDLVGLLPG
jgi:C4-dicarboxylate-binding protein DctP